MLDVGDRKMIEAENVFMGKKVLATHAGPSFMPCPYIYFTPNKNYLIE